MQKLKFQYFGHLMAKNWLTGKDPDAGKYWEQEEKGMIEDEMVGWHHWLDGREFEQALGTGDGQETLACWRPWGHKESDMTEELNWQQVCYSFFNIQWGGKKKKVGNPEAKWHEPKKKHLFPGSSDLRLFLDLDSLRVWISGRILQY